MESLREKKRLRTRTRLAEAALDLFEEKGFDETTLEEVAAAADVSPRTLFRYFATKRDLIFGDTDAYLALLRELVRERPAHEPPLVAIANAFVALAPSIEGDDLNARRMALARANPILRRQWAVAREAWAETLAGELAHRAGARAADARLELTAGLGQRIFGQALLVWHATEGAPLTDVLLEQLRAAREIVSQLDDAEIRPPE